LQILHPDNSDLKK